MNEHRWPPERFYWALAELPGWRGSGPAPPGLLPALADEVPQPVEELHAVCARHSDGLVVVCAALRNDLEPLQREAASSLLPSGLPDAVSGGCPGSADELNLLVGEFEPRTRRRQRLRDHACAAATLLLCALMLAVGLGRRSHRWEEMTESARAAQASVAASVAPGVPTSFLEAELARTRQLGAAGPAAIPVDAIPVLSTVLREWPTGVEASPQSVAVTGRSALLSVNVPGDPGTFLSALNAPKGWVLEEPRLSSSGGLTRLSLSMRPSGKEGTP